MAKVDMSSITPKTDQYLAEQKESDASRKKLAPVVSSDAVVSTKKSFGSKLKDEFLDDAANDIKSYIIYDVLIPGAKATVMNIMKMLFYGEADSSYDDYGYVSYQGYYDKKRSRNRGRSRRSEDRYYREDDEPSERYRNVVLRDRRDAERVIDDMWDLISDTGSCSIAEFYDLLGKSGDHTDIHYGWTRKNQIGLRKVNKGWLIDVERARYIG